MTDIKHLRTELGHGRSQSGAADSRWGPLIAIIYCGSKEDNLESQCGKMWIYNEKHEKQMSIYKYFLTSYLSQSYIFCI